MRPIRLPTICPSTRISICSNLVLTCPRARHRAALGFLFDKKFFVFSVDKPPKLCYDNQVVETWCFGSVGRAHRSHRWGHWFESSKHHQKEEVIRKGGLFFLVSFIRLEPVCPIDVPQAHRWGAEPKRALWAMKRGGSVVSKGACRAAARAGDYCEPDRAQARPLVRVR